MSHLLCLDCHQGYDSDLGCRCKGGASPDDHLKSLAMIPKRKPVSIPESHPILTWNWRGSKYGLFIG